MSDVLDGIDGIVCDLDGVVYRGDVTIPGAPEGIAALRARGTRIVFCTNNSTSTVAQYLSKLGARGIEATPEEMLTSAVVVAEVLDARHARGKRAIVVGGDGVREALSTIGVVIDEGPDVREADFVVVGMDVGFDYATLRRAAAAVRAGAELIATNDDATFPAPEGLWPGAGALVAAIEVASGTTAEVMGKPHLPMMEVAARRLGGARAIAMVGDRPETDLAGAAAMGWTTVLVLSGVTSRAEAARLEPPPDVVLESLAALA